MLPLTATGPEVFVATMNKFLSDSYDDLEETLTHMKSLKLNIYPGVNVTDFFAAILIDADHLESARAFNPEHLGHITCIFRILLTPYYVFGGFISTRRLRSL